MKYWFNLLCWAFVWCLALHACSGRPQQAQNPRQQGSRNFEGGFQPNNGIRFPDDVVRPVGRRQPQNSQAQRPPQNVQNQQRPPQNVPNQQGPPQNTQNQQRAPQNTQNQQRPPQNTQIQRRPSNNRPVQPQRPAGRINSNRTPTSPSSPAIRPPHLFVRPLWDVFGNPINFGIIEEDPEEILPDFGKPRPTKRPDPRPPGPTLGPDLKPRLPAFRNPDILQATEELRSRDVNHESILPIGNLNAGVLPLAFEVPDEQPGLFPPFAPLKNDDQEDDS